MGSLSPDTYLFRVIREKVDGKTIRILLEPYDMLHPHIELSDGDEFITGTLAIDPWDELD